MKSMKGGVQVCELLMESLLVQPGSMKVRQNLPGAAGMISGRGYADCAAKDGKKKTMTICQAPPNEPKVIPPYEYGYCREPDPEPPTGCPKKEEKKRDKGPCCKSQKKQGCRG